MKYDDPKALKVLLQTCYGPESNYKVGDFWSDEQVKDAEGTTKKILFHVRVYEVADKYDFPGLRDNSVESAGDALDA